MRRILALLVLLAIPAVAQFGGPMGGMRPGSMQGGGLLPGRGGDPLWVAAGPTKPTLDFDFAKRKDLTDAVSGKTSLVTFARSAAQSPGTYVGSDGLIHDAAVNLALYSEQFENAWWSKVRTTISANQIIAPDGKQTADKIVENTLTGAHYLYRSYSGFSVSTTYTQSIYLKAGGRDKVVFFASIDGTLKEATIDLSAGTISSSTFADTPQILDAGNGWYKFSVNQTASSSSAFVFYLSMLDDSDAISYEGDGTSGIYAWGAQLEETDPATMAPTAYIKTTSQALAAPRFDHDPVTGESLGLLVEEARTNYDYPSTTSSLHVNGTIFGVSTFPTATNSYAVAPDGSLSGTRLQFAATTARFGPQSSATNQHIPDGDYNATTSLWAKSANGSNYNVALIQRSTTTPNIASVTLTITPEWQRFSLTSTRVAGQGTTGWYLEASGTQDIIVWGYQHEIGSFPTSYIPTTSGPQTRYADVAAVQDEDFSTTNLMSYSESFDVGWTTSGLDPVAPNATTAPDGQTTADRVIESAASTQHYISTPNSLAVQITSGVKYTFSVFVKKGTGSSAPDIIQMNPRTLGFSYLPYANFNISTGSVTLQSGGNAGIQSYGNGWFKITLTATADTTISVNTGITIGFCNNNPNAVKNPTYAGSTNSDVYLWGASLTATEYPVEYTTTRNLLTDSQDFERGTWGNSGTILYDDLVQAPDGTLTAQRIANGLNGHLYRPSIVPAGTYIRSIWAKVPSGTATVSLLGRNDASNVFFTLTDEWQRFEAQVTDGTLIDYFYVVDFRNPLTTATEIHVWGAQLEPGTTATDYVRTVDAVGKDYGWYEPTEGTVFVEAYNERNVGATHTLYGISDGSNTYRIQGYFVSGNLPYALSSVPTTYTVNIGSLSFPSTYKHVYSFAVEDHAIGVNGASNQSSPAGFLPPAGLKTMMIGQRGDGTNKEISQKHIKRLTYWPRRQADSTLQVITQ